MAHRLATRRVPVTQKADHPQTPPSPEERGVVTDVVVPIAQTVASTGSRKYVRRGEEELS
jgi:hypothetical protein